MSEKNLHRINKKGFQVPKDYFKSIENDILLAVSLEKYHKNAGFKTPDDYFDHLEASVLIKKTAKPKGKLFNLLDKKQVLYLTGIAASFFLLLHLSLNNMNTHWDQIDRDLVEHYILEENISLYDVSSFISENDLKDLHFINHNNSHNLIESYLIDQTDIVDLIIE